MSECDDLQAIWKVYEHNVVRKRVNRHSSNVVIGNSWYATADERKSLYELEGAPRLRDEAIRNTRISISNATQSLPGTPFLRDRGH